MATNFFFRLFQGRKVADISFDADNIPSASEKAALAGTSGTPSVSNKFVTNSDTRMTDSRTPTAHGNEAHSSTFITASAVTYEALNTNGDVGVSAGTLAVGNDSRFPTADQKAALGAAPNALSASNPVADKQYVDNMVDGLEWYPSVDKSINYIKSDFGSPAGAGLAGEIVLSTYDNKWYLCNGGASWEAGVLATTGQRFVFMVSGNNTSGANGSHTKTNKIYEFNGTTFVETTPTKGATFNLDTNGLDYRYDGTSLWIEKASTLNHNNLSGLQGGTTSEYYHLTQAQQQSIAGANSPSSTNVLQTYKDRKPFVLSWAYYGGLAANQTDVEPYNDTSMFQRILMPGNFRIVKTSYQATGARTAGSLTIEPTIDGTKVTPSDLDITVDGTTPNDAYKSVAADASGYNGNAGQKLGFKITSSSDWAPNNADIEIKAWVVFD